jgi:hypothetical protein
VLLRRRHACSIVAALVKSGFEVSLIAHFTFVLLNT